MSGTTLTAHVLDDGRVMFENADGEFLTAGFGVV
jgi:hypothetical protein